ncbi:MAG: N-6 DNA methylase [Candidatus Moranbacteria bacterium]|nr:N-6 DNA methylase [Candidatus Moranbacteria bacterium]
MVRKKLEKAGISEANGFLIEEQKSQSPIITNLLKKSSKSGGGHGKPEFLISKNDERDFILVIECKPDGKHHESKDKNQFKDYAVDGALLYAAHLSKEFNVIAIGISGQAESLLKISTFLHPKGASSANILFDENNHPIEKIISWKRYIDRATFDPALAKARHSDLMKFSRELHNYMRDYAKITEAQKPLLVSGILLALMDKGFEKAYIAYEGEDLAQETFHAIKSVIGKAQLGDTQDSKKRAVINAFSFIEHHPELHKIDKKKNESPLLHIIRDLHVHVNPFTKDHYDFDIIGNFYGEFIRYTGGDGKGLGIVLTPKHITDLFADLAKLNKNSVVLDTCCGTGGFLISAMKKMTKDVSSDEKKYILDNSLIGIEQEPQMFALAVSNMILRGDGKTNLYQGSCFDETLFDKVKGKASAGFINPPYSQKGEDLHEWNFIIQLLNALQKNAVGIVIVPMSLAIAKHPLREQLLKEHRLEAVMSMPDDLFYPAGSVPCIMLFTAHVPHDSDSHHETWFGYWKDDGFRKDKILGRIPKDEKLWTKIKEKWIVDFTNRKEILGISARRKVGINDEWCAEAYLKTNYEILDPKDFTKTAIMFAAFMLENGDISFAKEIFANKKIVLNLSDRKWEYFSIVNLFELERGKCGSAEKLLEKGDEINYIGAKKENNGFMYKVVRDEKFVTKGNGIVFIGDGQGSVGYSTYQPNDFIGSTTLSIGRNKNLNRYIGLFIVALLDKERFKYSFGRKWNGEKLKNTKIKLPVDSSGNPDWQFMEDYIKSLPYSAEI